LECHERILIVALIDKSYGLQSPQLRIVGNSLSAALLSSIAFPNSLLLNADVMLSTADFGV